MKKHVMWVSIIVLLVLAGSTALDIIPTRNFLLEMLHFVPVQTRSQAVPPLIAYGDLSAWHQSWNIPRIDSLDGLISLDNYQRNYWWNILPKQTFPPDDVGIVTQNAPNWGFSLFNVDRYIYTVGYDPDALTIEYSFDTGEIRQALTAIGLRPEFVDENLTVFGGSYGAFSDYFGLIKNGPLVLSHNRDAFREVLDLQRTGKKSLADDPSYRSAAAALFSSELDDTGDLMGALFLDGASIAKIGPKLAVSSRTRPVQLPQEIEKIVNEFPPLPVFNLAVLATRHVPGFTYQIVEVVFPQGVDTTAASESLTERVKTYVSLDSGTNYLEANDLVIDRTLNLTISGLSVVLIVLRAPDPPLEFPPGLLVPPNSVPTRVPDWRSLVTKLDYGFLAVTTGCSNGCS